MSFCSWYVLFQQIGYNFLSVPLVSFPDLVGILRKIWNVYYENSLQQVWGWCDKLVADWLNSLQISNTEFDGKQAYGYHRKQLIVSYDIS